MKPILSNKQMVNAILDGRKTVIRVPITPQPCFFFDSGGKITDPDNPEHIAFIAIMDDDDREEIYIPPNQPGDILYVKETWTAEGKQYYYRADFESDFLDPCETLSGGYPASCATHPGCEGCFPSQNRIVWRPSTNMPKAAARIFLRVTDVRVERLHDMTEDDALREGVFFHPEMWTFRYSTDKYNGPTAVFWSTAIEAFRYNMWYETIKPKDVPLFGWDANPWIWVIEFERITKTEALNE